MRTNILTILSLLLSLNLLYSQQVNWPEAISSADLVWAKVDSNFYNGAFIGDGIQGAMIMRDALNPDGIRMLMGHYKAIAHNSISGWEYCDSRVYAGNIVIDPAGKSISQNMRLNIFNGEANGTIITDKGKLTWTAFSDRKNLVFVVTINGENGEIDATAGVREEWGITPRIYLENKNTANYASSLPPKPVKSKQGEIELVINKMKNRGAHVVASQVVEIDDNSKVLFVTIGVDDTANTATAASKATADAVTRVQSAVAEGVELVRLRNRNWWNNYMLSSKLAINEDPYWQKFWWLQMYKFGCASSETSDFVIDTQGPWIWETAWAAVWWNLNVQLSYYPMFSGNKLEAGRSLINGVDRLYKSGALKQNAGGIGIDIGRSTTYEGKGNWGNEYGNLPWVFHCYWKYWQYSGDDEIGKKLFPMLKDNADFLITKLEKQADGKYHLKPSRSPEYTDNVLLADANYSLMSVHWVMKTLLEMNSYFGFNDTKKTKWQDVIDNLVAFPTNSNGFMVGAGQGFDMGHRHYSHLLAVYPYHTVTTDNGQTDIIKKSVNRWLSLTEASGHAGYTFTGGCAMLATLGDGSNALRLMDKLKTDKLQPNTMYAEGGGPVVETPLSGVESINYMLLQSWGGIIRVFPAVPSRWKNVSFENLRTEGAFLVSANLSNGIFDHFFVFSEKGKECKVKSPWKDKKLVVKDETGSSVPVVFKDGNFVFTTQTGKKYRVEIAKEPDFKSAVVKDNPGKIAIKLTEKLLPVSGVTGFSVQKNNDGDVAIDSVIYSFQTDTVFIFPESPIQKTDEITISYSDGNLISVDSIALKNFTRQKVDNLLPGSSPSLVSALTNGFSIHLIFNKNLLNPVSLVTDFKVEKKSSGTIGVTEIKWDSIQPEMLELQLNDTIYKADQILLSYSGSSVFSADSGAFRAVSEFQVVNNAAGKSPVITAILLTDKGKTIQMTFEKSMVNFENDVIFFDLKINGQPAGISSLQVSGSTAKITTDAAIWYDDFVTLSYSGELAKSTDGGKLNDFTDLKVLNNLSVPVLKTIPGKIEAEDYYSMYGIQTEWTSDAGGGKNIGYIDSGDWLEYAINVKNEGDYNIEFRIAGLNSASEITLQKIGLNAENIASTTIQPTGGWQKWTTINFKVNLKAGRQILRVYFSVGGINLNWINLMEITTGINRNYEKKIKIYPNPVKNEISIVSSDFQYDKIVIYDLMGKEVFSEKIQYQANFSLPINLKPGLYLLNILNEHEFLSKKFKVN